MAVKCILRCFEVVSGLKINFHKSMICGVGVEDGLVEEFAAKLNCPSHKLPLKYLGLPLEANPGRKQTWQPIVDRFKKKLSRWKRIMLSYARKVTLIKSVLSSLPIYYMSLFKIPKCVAKEIDKIQARFLWGRDESKRKIHLVKWKEVQLNKNQGGLGIRDIRLTNECLLLKWWWRYALEDEALWKSVICAKYGVSGGQWFPPLNDFVSVSIIWRDALAMSYLNPRLYNFFVQNVELRIGDGNRVKFWDDISMGTSSLKSRFPRLYQLNLDKEITLKMQISCRDSTNKWFFNFRRPLFGWEEDG